MSGQLGNNLKKDTLTLLPRKRRVMPMSSCLLTALTASPRNTKLMRTSLAPRRAAKKHRRCRSRLPRLPRTLPKNPQRRLQRPVVKRVNATAVSNWSKPQCGQKHKMQHRSIGIPGSELWMFSANSQFASLTNIRTLAPDEKCEVGGPTRLGKVMVAGKSSFASKECWPKGPTINFGPKEYGRVCKKVNTE